MFGLVILSGYMIVAFQSFMTRQTIPDVPDYWPDIGDDLTKVIWSHATNSQELLGKAIEGEIMMIEADVSLGTLTSTSNEVIPIMAHPPSIVSDLSLEMFITDIVTALEGGIKKKGAKLDFKSIEVVEKSLKILQNFTRKINFPLWLNADILEGPRSSEGIPRKPVDAEEFLALCLKYFPTSTLSPGFTTGVPDNPEERKYTTSQVEQMKSALEKSGAIGRRITYPVRAILVGKSFDTLSWLLDSTSTPDVKATLTIWGGDEMTFVEKIELFETIMKIGIDRIYWDVPFPFEPIN